MARRPGSSALQILNGQRREANHEHYLKFLLNPREVHGLDAGVLSPMLALAAGPASPGPTYTSRSAAPRASRT